MTAHATLEIGAIRIGFRPTSPEAACRFSHPYASFLSRGTPDVALDVHRGPPPLLPSDHSLCFDTESTWCMVKANGMVGFYACAYDDIPGGSTMGLVMTPDFTRGDLYVHRPWMEQEAYPENPMLYAPLNQIFVSHLLAQGRGLLLHACGVLDGGRSWCFAAASGLGKSTMARLWDGEATILNDDRIILRPQGDGFWIYGTPWHGDYPSLSPEGCPLTELFLLARGPENHLRQLSPGEAASRLLVASFPPLWDREGMDWTLQLLDRLTTSIPVYELTFRPDETAVPFLRQTALE